MQRVDKNDNTVFNNGNNWNIRGVSCHVEGIEESRESLWGEEKGTSVHDGYTRSVKNHTQVPARIQKRALCWGKTMVVMERFQVSTVRQ